MHKRNTVRLLSMIVVVIGLVSACASSAQAKYLILLNGASVSLMNLSIEIGPGSAKVENGLKISCTGGFGSAHGELVGGGAKVVGSATATFTGCTWVGSEKTCTINDGGVGLIHGGGSGEIQMPTASEYTIAASSEEFATIHTEGIFCTIPEEEVVSGTATALIENALEDLKVHTGKLKSIAMFLGNSKVTEVTGNVWVKDQDANATFAIHLVEL